jgi:hypothetical protein
MPLTGKAARLPYLGLGALTLAGILFRAWIFLHLPYSLSTCSADFAAFYAGGKLEGTPLLYSPDAAFAVERQAMGCSHPNLIFIKPPFYALLMRPFAAMPFPTALTLWRILGLLAVAAFIALWPGSKWAAAAACAWSFPLAANFTTGQDVSFVLLGLLAAWRLLKSNRDFAAGLLLGLCGIKFHLLLLLPLLILQRRLWRTALGGVCVSAAFIAASFLAAGPNWLQQYRAALQSPRMNPLAENMVNLRGLFGYGSPWVWPAALAVMFLCWYLISKGSLEISFAAAIIGGVLITPHNTICDALLFLPALLMAQKSPLPLMRVMATFTLTPLYRFLPAGTLQVLLLTMLCIAVWMQSRRPKAATMTAVAAS